MQPCNGPAASAADASVQQPQNMLLDTSYGRAKSADSVQSILFLPLKCSSRMLKVLTIEDPRLNVMSALLFVALQMLSRNGNDLSPRRSI